MELEALIDLAWLLVGGALFFLAMRYAAARRSRAPENPDPVPANGHTLSARSPTAVRDPVCGMTVEPSEDISWIHSGRTYYFCSMSCRGRFRNAPDKFIGPREATRNRDA